MTITTILRRRKRSYSVMTKRLKMTARAALLAVHLAIATVHLMITTTAIHEGIMSPKLDRRLRIGEPQRVRH
jgi:hypothetical protein